MMNLKLPELQNIKQPLHGLFLKLFLIVFSFDFRSDEMIVFEFRWQIVQHSREIVKVFELETRNKESKYLQSTIQLGLNN